MKTFLMAVVFAFVCGWTATAQDAPQPSKPTKEHEWLQKFVGEWESEGECYMGPEKTIKTKGTESCTSLGKIWIVSHIKGETPMGPMQGLMTIGYDEGKKKFVGTWVDSMMNHLWTYEGEVDATGKILTLNSEGPDMMDPKKKAKYRDITELKSDDLKVMRSEVQMADGKWMKMMEMTGKRVKK